MIYTYENFDINGFNEFATLNQILSLYENGYEFTINDGWIFCISKGDKFNE